MAGSEWQGYYPEIPAGLKISAQGVATLNPVLGCMIPSGSDLFSRSMAVASSRQDSLKTMMHFKLASSPNE